METALNGVVTLDKLKEQFAAWRTRKKSRAEAIPLELWDGAVHAALSSSVIGVAKALGLDSGTLKKKVRLLEQSGKQTNEPTFARTSLGSVPSPETSLPMDRGWRLTIERPDGTTLRVCVPRADRGDLLKVATQFLR